MPERHYRELLRYFIRKAGNGDAAADVVQEAYMRVFALEHGGGTIREPRALLFQAARNIWTNQIVRRAAELRMLETLAVVRDDSVPSVEREVMARQQLAHLVRLLSSMPRKRREVFVLVRIHGLSYAQTCAHLDLSLKAVEHHMTRALLDCAGYGRPSGH